MDDFDVGSKVFLRDHADTPYDVIYKTETHIVILLEGDTAPRSLSNNTFMLLGPQKTARAAKEDELVWASSPPYLSIEMFQWNTKVYTPSNFKGQIAFKTTEKCVHPNTQFRTMRIRIFGKVAKASRRKLIDSLLLQSNQCHWLIGVTVKCD